MTSIIIREQGGGTIRIVDASPAAVAAANRAEAAAAAAEAVGATNDTIIAGRINTPGSATRVALDGTIGAAVAPAVQDYLTANPPSGAPDATGAVKGVVKLAGDLGGTADAPTIPALSAKLDTSAAPELIRDTIGTALVAGTNVTITPNDGGDTITIAATDSSGVDPTDVGYDVVILAGQSNMSGSGGPLLTSVYDTPDPRIWQYAASGTYQGSIIRGLDPLENPAPDASSEVGPGMQFAREWLRRVPQNRSVLLVPTAIGGSNLVSGPWEAPSGAYYTQAVALANAAVSAAGPNARVVAILWHQGEGDSIGNQPGATYATELDEMVTAMRANITGAAEAPFVLGGMVPEWRTVPNGTSLEIHAAHLATPTRLANAYFIDGPTGCEEDFEGIHYNARGARAIGAAMCEVLFTGTGVPSAVTGLTATPGDGQVVLAWKPSVAVPPVTDYVVQYKLSASGSWSTFADGTTTVAGTTVTGLTNDSEYDFRVAATNSAGTGGYSTVASATPEVTVVPFPDAAFLVDARTLGVSNGASVATWPDLSTGDHDPTQGTGTAQPTYRATGVGGEPSVEFDGGDALAVSVAVDALTDASGNFSIVVVAQAANGNDKCMFAMRDDSEGLFHLAQKSGGNVEFSAINGASSNAIGTGMGSNVPTVITGTRDSTGAKVWVNGVAGTPGAAGAPSTTPATKPLTIGRISSAIWYYTGHVSYAAVFPFVLTDEERETIESTLAAEFGA